MKKSIRTTSCLAALTVGLTSVSANAALFLTYDSNSTGVTASSSSIQLDAIDNANTSPDSAFVSSYSATTFTSTGTVARNSNNQQIVSDRAGVNTAGTGDDISFNLGGSGSAFSSAANPLTVGNVSSNPYIGLNFTAAQDITLDSLTFNLSVNSGGGGYAARDVGLFVSLDSGAFTQFGDIIDNSGAGNQGVQTFTESNFTVTSGQAVELRLLFTDKTNSSAGNSNIQGGTRVGNIEIFGTAAAIPEPSSTALLGLGALGLLVRRKR